METTIRRPSLAAPLLRLTLALTLIALASCASAPPASAALPAEAAMNRLAQDLLVSLPSPLRLGIDDFHIGSGRKTALGRYLGDLFVSSLLSQGGGAVTPVERKRLDAALAEANYDLGQLIDDPARFARVGAFLPAQAVAAASMTVLADRISLSLRVFAVSTGEIIAASTVSIRRDQDIEAMVPQL